MKTLSTILKIMALLALLCFWDALTQAYAATATVTEKAMVRKISRSLISSYADILKRQYNADLTFEVDWGDTHVNASQDRNRDAFEDDHSQETSKSRHARFSIYLAGGLLKTPGISADAITLIACHELGHLIGGGPRMAGPYFASAEGQSDYFAAAMCAKNVWKLDDNRQIMSRLAIPPSAVQQCESSYEVESAEYFLCIRQMTASENLMTVLWRNDKNSTSLEPPRLNAKERSTAPTTLPGYASYQCRLDTYVAGALCHAHTLGHLKCAPDDNTDLITCPFKSLGGRPACWYNPSSFLYSEDQKK